MSTTYPESNSSPPLISIRIHVLGQEKLLHDKLHSVPPPKFWSTPSPQTA
ncbi:hypothetical protein Tco_0638902, partial [Tanacetum coccineum]